MDSKNKSTKNKSTKNKDEKKELSTSLDNFLDEKECVGDECFINDGKEIVERVNKVYKTNDGRQLLM